MMTDPLFVLVITASMGILSCITTGWWGAVSLTISSQTNCLMLGYDSFPIDMGGRASWEYLS